MKKLNSILSVVLLVISVSCVNGQIMRSVSGDGHVVTRDRNVRSFTGIKVSSGIDVFVSQGDNESLKVEADENLHEYIITEVRDGILHVYSKENIRRAEMERVYVTMKEIRSMSTTSAGDITASTPIKGSRLEFSASSAGNIKAEISADEVEVDISSSGDITLSGHAETLEADLSSAGDLNAFELEVKEADVSVSSAGDADINVSDKLTARASSAGDINYKGDPRSVDAHSSSAGGIHRR